jgi:hypothetical protein
MSGAAASSSATTMMSVAGAWLIALSIGMLIS